MLTGYRNSSFEALLKQRKQHLRSKSKPAERKSLFFISQNTWRNKYFLHGFGAFKRIQNGMFTSTASNQENSRHDLFYRGKDGCNGEAATASEGVKDADDGDTDTVARNEDKRGYFLMILSDESWSAGGNLSCLATRFMATLSKLSLVDCEI